MEVQVNDRGLSYCPTAGRKHYIGWAFQQRLPTRLGSAGLHLQTSGLAALLPLHHTETLLVAFSAVTCWDG